MVTKIKLDTLGGSLTVNLPSNYSFLSVIQIALYKGTIRTYIKHIPILIQNFRKN